MSHPLLKTLAEIGVNVSVAGDRLRLMGNLHALTDDMKADLQREKRAIMACLAPYPDSEGQVKCCYCTRYQDHACTHGHRPDGISLLRECGEFVFNRVAFEDFCERNQS